MPAEYFRTTLSNERSLRSDWFVAACPFAEFASGTHDSDTSDPSVDAISICEPVIAELPAAGADA